MSQWNKRKNLYDNEMGNILTLGQKATKENPELRDYACNVYAPQIAQINCMIELFKDDAETKATLESLKNQMISLGRALWMKNSDPLTNLGALVGNAGAREPIRGKPE